MTRNFLVIIQGVSSFLLRASRTGQCSWKCLVSRPEVEAVCARKKKLSEVTKYSRVSTVVVGVPILYGSKFLPGN